jgi:hypothetical protein
MLFSRFGVALMRCLNVFALCLMVVLFLTASTIPLAAQEPARLTVAAADLPAEVAEPIRKVLNNEAVNLANGDSTFFQFWFRKELPLLEQPAGGTITLGTLQEGTVLGVLKVHSERYDFRDEEIPVGIYILRFGIQPEDGNHLGVAPTRTFAVLIPAQADTQLDPVSHEELMKAAAAINAASHPSNLNLQPVEQADGAFPRLEERNDGQHKALLLQLPARVSGSSDGTKLNVALVYEGTGQL